MNYAFEYKEPPYQRNWPQIGYTLSERAAALRQLCAEMEQLSAAVLTFGGAVPHAPRAVVEMRLALFESA